MAAAYFMHSYYPAIARRDLYLNPISFQHQQQVWYRGKIMRDSLATEERLSAVNAGTAGLATVL